MTNTPPEDLFERYESQYVRDLEGRLIRVEAATQADLTTLYTVTIDGRRVEGVPRAVPTTDDQGNIRRDEAGLVIPRLTTVYDATTWRYRNEPNPIPVLCHQNHQRPVGVCRVCCVLTTRRGQPGSRLIPACQHPLVDGMEVHTVASDQPLDLPGGTQRAGDQVSAAVRVLLELLAANHLHQDQPPDNRRYQNELLALLRRFQIGVATQDGRLAVQTAFQRRPQVPAADRLDNSSPVIQVDHDNCILCDRCVRGCSEVKPFKIIGHTGFGKQARISFDLGQPMGESGCVSCGECAVSCPTGALTFKGSIYRDTRRPQGDQERDPWADEPLRPRTVRAEELEKIPLFAGVPYAFLKWTEGSVGRVEAQPGLVLCRQGEYGSTAFVIEKGEIEVHTGQQVLRRTPEDVILGELACLSHQPRTATLKAGAAGATVLVIKRNLLHMLQRNPVARSVLAPIYRRRALDVYLQQGQLFAGLDEKQNRDCLEFLKQRADVTLTQVDPGQAVFLQGSRADAFYIVYLGHVSVAESNAQGHTTVRDYLGAGRQFGEIGLLSDPEVSPTVARLLPPEQCGRRTGSCTALDHVELVSISREAFLALLRAYPNVWARLEETACALVEKNRQARHEVGHLLGEFTGAGLYQGQNLLVLELNRCTRCQECVKACAESHDGVTRLVLEGNRFGEYLVPSACRSCHDPVCLVGCPVDAIHRRPANPKRPGVQSLAIVIEDWCIGCTLCARNCPFGSIHMYEVPPERGWPSGKRMTCTGERIATNCDLCESLDGNPRCVHHCPHDAAIRQEGIDVARKVGLNPLGPAHK
jgi:Fe-S-cluster-containing hydrogenase component 2/CRP-like cAMP-binding protein